MAKTFLELKSEEEWQITIAWLAECTLSLTNSMFADELAMSKESLRCIAWIQNKLALVACRTPCKIMLNEDLMIEARKDPQGVFTIEATWCVLQQEETIEYIPNYSDYMNRLKAVFNKG